IFGSSSTRFSQPLQSRLSNTLANSLTSPTVTSGWYFTACQKCSVESYLAPYNRIPSSIGYQFESTLAAITGEALQQFSECRHFSCTARNASAYPLGIVSFTAATASCSSALVCVTSASSGRSSIIDTTRLSTASRSNVLSSPFNSSSLILPFQRFLCDSM